MAITCPKCLVDNTGDSTYCRRCGSQLPLSADLQFAKTMTLDSVQKILSEGSCFADRYKILGELGRGGMGIVYQAEDTKLKRLVALKFLPSELSRYPEAKKRFIREAQAAAVLDHPNICTVHEVGEAEGVTYIAMAYVEGQSLREKVLKKPLAPDQAVDIVLQVALGLEEAHKKGIIHRDIKSGNIMVKDDGLARIMDFGLAKVAGESVLTREAKTMGTVAYMSPEQARGEVTDHRTDIWSLGVVLYEMLAGELPFRGERETSIMYAILHEEPRSMARLEPNIPAELIKIVERALRKNRDARYASAAEMARDLIKYREFTRAEAAGVFNIRSLLKRLRKPRVAIPAAFIVAAIAFFAFSFFSRQAKIRWAERIAFPEIRRLYEASDFRGAYKLASRAEKFMPRDPRLQEILADIIDEVTIETEPPGASIYYKSYRAVNDPWEFFGKTPLRDARMVRGYWRLKAEMPSYEIAERATEAFKKQNSPRWKIAMKISLDPQGSVPPGMVHIQGSGDGARPLDLGGLQNAGSVRLPGYFIDRYEVSNKQFKRFMENGGYREPKYWIYPFVQNGHTLSREKGLKLLVDKTGLPGPSTWELGDFLQGQDDYPVSGVSWYEAAAYAEFSGKSLPTVYHWALSQGRSQIDSPFLLPLSNFKGRGPVPVGSSMAMSPSGTYDQCGNVKEWCWNAMGGKRLTLGGCWKDPNYMGYNAEPFDAFRRDDGFGFRCMQYLGDKDVQAKALDQIPEPQLTDFRQMKPCSDEVFAVIKGLYAYQKSDLDPVVEFRREHSEYAILEKVSFWDAEKKSRIPVYIFLPRKFKPPYQAVIYYPGAMAWNMDSFFDYPFVEAEVYFKHGRAFVFPVYSGTFERRKENPQAWTPQSVRERRIRIYRDLARSIDYLETRPADFRADKLAYHGMSSGAVYAPIMGALETRLKAIIALGGGMSTTRTSSVPYGPEVDYVNFYPRVKTPFLLLNGKYDHYAPLETNLNVLMQLLGTPEKDKYVKLYETGHLSLEPVTFRDMLDFLNKYLGPVE